MTTPLPIQLDNIQGNSFGGFSKDHEAVILLEILDVKKARATLTNSGIAADTAESSSDNVLKFNNQFKTLRAEHVPEGSITATWTNTLFTAVGLQKLGAPGIADFPEAFLNGMLARAAKI